MQKNNRKLTKKYKNSIKFHKKQLFFRFLWFFVGLITGFLIYALNIILFKQFSMIINTCFAVCSCLFLVYNLIKKIKELSKIKLP